MKFLLCNNVETSDLVNIFCYTNLLFIDVDELWFKT